MVHPDDLSQTPANVREVLMTQGKYNAEYRIMTPRGIRWIASTAVATFRSGARELTGMSGTFQDITERKTQEATLRQSEKLAATGRLAATIAHEINNPLEAVTNLIYLCKTDPTVPTPIQRLLDTADDELARVAQIAQQTLGFYRDTARPSEIDVAVLLSSVVDLFSRKLLSKKLVCTLDIAKDLRIVGLPGEIKQVFSNLLVNAIDASKFNTIIRIRGKSTAHEGKRGVSVLMADQGTGIPENVRERLFSPFFTTKESLGTGLGLWVTRGIVEKQGGRIDFRTCTEPPTGTVFRVFLPAELEDPDTFGAPHSGFIQ
jgi:signal transduction histidine kinase